MQITCQIQHILIVFSFLLFVMGRICDDMDWHQFQGISHNNFKAISIAGLAGSAFIILALRIYENQKWKAIIWSSQIKFTAAWGLITLLCYLNWKIFGCYKNGQVLVGQQMDYTGCIRYTVILILSNINYSLICNQFGEILLLIVFEITLFAEIIYYGILLVDSLGSMKMKQKDYQILYISILIAWQVLVMDLIYRASLQEKIHQQRHQKLKIFVTDHHQKCKKVTEFAENITIQNDQQDRQRNIKTQRNILN